MNAYYYLNFSKGRRISTVCQLDKMPPLHTNIVFPSNHSEVSGFLRTMVVATTVYLGRTSEQDYLVIDLEPIFSIGIEAFIEDQKRVGRFSWQTVSEDVA